MDPERRRRLAREALGGYANGPDAPVLAEAEAGRRAASARHVVLVEGISDQMALETLAAIQGRQLSDEGVVVVPIGGAHAIGRSLAHFGPAGRGLGVTGLCDEAEEPLFRRAFARAGAEGGGGPRTGSEAEPPACFVCVRDLEDELIRALPADRIEALLDGQGDLVSFRTMQRQPAWRDGAFAAQFHRWLRAGARRNLRYARLLVAAIDHDRWPAPLVGALAVTGAGAGRAGGR
ncbi:MAG: TOPRIM nucleotidyl transferase/hydrolase domain-containing protein [Actinomycetota bacterium]